MNELISVMDENQELRIYEPNEIVPDYEVKVSNLRMEDPNNILNRTIHNVCAATALTWCGEPSSPFMKVWLD
ncbi:MAG: hypothetical protein MJZ34_11115 [Paludibacteraceae bacterium]|nr:hypothetical protein [Paludibacteraceae bacterium]